METETLDIQPDTAGDIFGAMAMIQAEIGAVAKGRTNQQQGYKFRGVDDIYQACQLVMAKHGVFSIPSIVSQEREERKTKKGDTWYWVCLTMDFTFFAEDGSHVTARTVGEGLDSGDKAANKAMSAAEKYCLIQTFKIPTTDARDSEHESPEPDAGKTRTAAALSPPPSVPVTEEDAAVKAIIEAARARWKPYIDSIKTPEAATACIKEISEDDPPLGTESYAAVKRMLFNKCKELRYVFEATTKRYVLPTLPEHSDQSDLTPAPAGGNGHE